MTWKRQTTAWEKRDDTYRGGRFVFGSGSTWPHDFRFLVGFLSDDAAGSASTPSSEASNKESGMSSSSSAREAKLAWKEAPFEAKSMSSLEPGRKLDAAPVSVGVAAAEDATVEPENSDG